MRPRAIAFDQVHRRGSAPRPLPVEFPGYSFPQCPIPITQLPSRSGKPEARLSLPRSGIARSPMPEADLLSPVTAA